MKPWLANFRFYEELNDFLLPEQRKQTIAYRFRGQPAIKDPIEALGVPHSEVDLINGLVVEEGSHHELLARGGVYSRLYELQFRDEE